jgi:hypothetical protein
MYCRIFFIKILCFVFYFFVACTPNKQKEEIAQDSKHNESSNKKDTNKFQKDLDRKAVAKTPSKTEVMQHLSAHKQLLQKLGTGIKLEYTEPDFNITKTDTLIKTKYGDYKISYATSCLNDTLIAQEMYNYSQYQKSYRFSHNYQTNIAMMLDGKPSGMAVINKESFVDKLERDFLEKSIMKHPQFMGFDEAKNEAVFQFLVGVPATDYVVLAGVNLSPQGQVRIIEIKMPSMD